MCLAAKIFITTPHLALETQVAYNSNKNMDAAQRSVTCMERYIADIGIFFAGTLVVLYMLWDKLFPEE